MPRPRSFVWGDLERGPQKGRLTLAQMETFDVGSRIMCFALQTGVLRGAARAAFAKVALTKVEIW